MKTVLKIAAGMGAAGLILILTISLITGKTALTSQDLGIDVDQLENGVGIRVGDHWMGMGQGHMNRQYHDEDEDYETHNWHGRGMVMEIIRRTTRLFPISQASTSKAIWAMSR